MPSFRRKFALSGCLGLLLVGCVRPLPFAGNPPVSSPGQTQQPAEQPLTTRIEQAELLWTAHQIASYQISIKTSSSAASYLIEISVKAGKIEEASNTCLYHEAFGRDCPPLETFEPENYTIDGLFKHLRSRAGTEAEQSIEVEFDQHFGFPSRYSYYEEGVLDGGGGYEIILFEPQ